jgi:hypothetical protein
MQTWTPARVPLIFAFLPEFILGCSAVLSPFFSLSSFLGS